jgi:hypothetical protein
MLPITLVIDPLAKASIMDNSVAGCLSPDAMASLFLEASGTMRSLGA